VGYAPGGGVDTTARFMAAALTESWSTQVLVENRPGANGLIAARETVRSGPDGYTLFLAATSARMPSRPRVSRPA